MNWIECTDTMFTREVGRRNNVILWPGRNIVVVTKRAMSLDLQYTAERRRGWAHWGVP